MRSPCRTAARSPLDPGAGLATALLVLAPSEARAEPDCDPSSGHCALPGGCVEGADACTVDADCCSMICTSEGVCGI
jgi:hypothetical protein